MYKRQVVKIPMTVEGLKAVKVLNAEGVKTNVTLVFSAAQALLAARAGASYVSPFLGRLDDISMPGIDLIYEITEIFQMHDIETVSYTHLHPVYRTGPCIGRFRKRPASWR